MERRPATEPPESDLAAAQEELARARVELAALSAELSQIRDSAEFSYIMTAPVERTVFNPAFRTDLIELLEELLEERRPADAAMRTRAAIDILRRAATKRVVEVQEQTTPSQRTSWVHPELDI